MMHKDDAAQSSDQAHVHPHRHVDGTVHAHEHDHHDHDHDGPHAAASFSEEKALRARRGEPMGQTRSTRLPASLDRWFEERLALHPMRSPSELLVELIHGGLRMREGYMAIHRRTLERLILRHDAIAYSSYVHCLFDTFGREYVEHLEAWLRADGLSVPRHDHE
jgi:hypothetical protein